MSKKGAEHIEHRTWDFDLDDDGRSEEEEEEEEEEITFLEACMDCDEEVLYEMLRDGVSCSQVNERDKSGMTGFSHACANGFLPIVELLVDLEDLDPNLGDNDGNTPLIYAAQAGHDDIISLLLNSCKGLDIEKANVFGLTPLMKAAIQGRTRCAKLLLFAGANPSRRDSSRRLCAEEWARFCGSHSCAASINKYIRSKKYFFKKTFFLSKCSSDPELAGVSKEERGHGNWIQRHLSLKKKARRKAVQDQGENNDLSGSAPLLCIDYCDDDGNEVNSLKFRRPSCFDHVLPMNITSQKYTNENVQKPKINEELNEDEIVGKDHVISDDGCGFNTKDYNKSHEDYTNDTLADDVNKNI